jgi:hypothetical protein
LKIIFIIEEYAKRNFCRCLVAQPGAEKLFYKKTPWILLALVRGGAAPATSIPIGQTI